MRLYRGLLRLYPASFRHEYGKELCRIFARRRRDATGPLPVLALWIGAVADTVVNGARVTWTSFVRIFVTPPGRFAARPASRWRPSSSPRSSAVVLES
jgi:hypothetical protein